MVNAVNIRQRLLITFALTTILLFSGVFLYIASPNQVVGGCIALLLCGVGLWLAVSRREIIYALLVLAIPLEATLVIEVGFSVTAYYLLFGLLALSYVIHRDRLSFSPTPVKIFAVYLIICAASMVAGMLIAAPPVYGSTGMALRASSIRPIVQILLMATHCLFFVFVLSINQERSQILRSLQWFIWIGLAIGVLACWQTLAVSYGLPGKDFTYAFGSSGDEYYKYGQIRFYQALITDFAPRATFRESMHLASYLVGVLPPAIVLVLYRKEIPSDWKIKVPRLLVALMFIALFLTMSRSGWMAFAAAMAFTFCFLPKSRVTKMVATTLVLVIAAGFTLQWLGYFRFDLSLWELMQVRMDMEMMEADPRVSYLQILWSTFKDSPILGVGIGNYGPIGASKLGIDRVLSAHSVFLNSLVETGVLGFLLVTGLVIHFFITAIRSILRCRGYAPYPYLVGTTAGVFGMSIQYCSFGDRFGFYYLFMLAIGYALIRLVEKNQFARIESSR